MSLCLLVDNFGVSCVDLDRLNPRIVLCAESQAMEPSRYVATLGSQCSHFQWAVAKKRTGQCLAAFINKTPVKQLCAVFGSGPGVERESGLCVSCASTQLSPETRLKRASDLQYNSEKFQSLTQAALSHHQGHFCMV
jgi:hypothetical protein